MSETKRLIHLVSASTWGGGERYALDLCRSFIAKGWSVTVYTRDAKAVDTHFRDAGIDIRNASLAGYYDMASVWTLSKHLRKESAGAIIHTHKYKDAFTALLARKLSGRKDIKVVMTRHLSKKGKDSALLRFVYRNLDMQIFVSEHARRSFLSTWENRQKPFDTGKIKVVHNSIMLDDFCRESEPDNGPLIAMFHGRLSAEKGLESLIDALPALKGKRTRLWIVGTGDPDYVDSLKRRATGLDVMNIIDWKGYVADVHSLIPRVHFGVLPSVCEEAFGLANIEYMAHGRPQICTANGAQSEYLTDGKEALFVAPGDSNALANALVKLAESSDLRTEMGKAALEKFSSSLKWEHFYSKIAAIYASR